MEISMAGTKVGGQKAASTNKTKYGKDFYAEIGRKGGRNGHTGGFASNPELARIAGRKGGLKSRRWKNKPIHEKIELYLSKIADGRKFSWELLN